MNVENLILFEDNHLFIINKPAGYASLPNDGVDDIISEAKAFIKARDKKAGNVFLAPVHRLDKQVSGILVCAKTSKALSRLNEQIRNKEWEKIYVAEVVKPLEKDCGKLVHYLCKRQFYADCYSSERPFSKKAILTYKKIKEGFYEICLETGRYHQIRAQLSFMNSPIVGDQKYNAPKRKSRKIHLHHARLTFKHPVTKKSLLIDSKPEFM